MTRLLAYRTLAGLALAWLGLLIGAPSASAMTIEKITSPSGISAWLVREQTVPLVTLNYAFQGGSSQDEPDKSGTANLAIDLLDEGAVRASRNRSNASSRCSLSARSEP